MKSMMEQLKKLPAWAWGVAAAGIAVALLFFRRSAAPAAVQYLPVTQPDPGPGGAPSSGSENHAPSENWEQLLGGLVADTRQQLATQGAWLERLSGSVSSLLTNNGRTTTTAGPVASVDPSIIALVAEESYQRGLSSKPEVPGAAPSVADQVNRTVNRYVATGDYAGYVQQGVTLNRSQPGFDILSGILDAKDAYVSAERLGDKSAMAAASAKADLLRQDAAKQQLQLPDWAGSGKGDSSATVNRSANRGITVV